jgi:hypothetical protein
VLKSELGLFIVQAPETVNELVPLIVIPLFADGAVKFIEVHAELTSTVTTTPEFIVTASPATGTEDPPHVAVLLQLPETDAVRFAANDFEKVNNKITRINKINLTSAVRNLRFIFFVFINNYCCCQLLIENLIGFLPLLLYLKIKNNICIGYYFH